MGSTLAVALITAVSTLSATAVTGYITLAISRVSNRSQLALANAERVEQRAATRRQARKDSYIQFLNQISVVENALDLAWRNSAPSEPEDAPKSINQATAELDLLTRLLNMVLLEGPEQVSSAAQFLQAKLTLESVDVVRAAKELPGKPPCLQDPKKFSNLHEERVRVKSAFIKSAKQAIEDDALLGKSDDRAVRVPALETL